MTLFARRRALLEHRVASVDCPVAMGDGCVACCHGNRCVACRRMSGYCSSACTQRALDAPSGPVTSPGYIYDVTRAVVCGLMTSFDYGCDVGVNTAVHLHGALVTGQR